MPLRYLWVFFAFMMLNKAHQRFDSEYKFVKNPKIGFAVGLWCFLFTAFACLLGIVTKMEFDLSSKAWWFQMISNILTPIVLILLGAILPIIAKRNNHPKPTGETKIIKKTADQRSTLPNRASRSFPFITVNKTTMKGKLLATIRFFCFRQMPDEDSFNVSKPAYLFVNLARIC